MTQQRKLIEEISSDLEIDFTPKTIGEWRLLLEQCPQANWMQTWAYAQAVFKRDYFKTQLVTVREQSKVIAILAIQSLQLGPFKFVNIKRGPLWLQGQATESRFQKLIQKLNILYSKSFFVRRNFMIESDNELNIERCRQIMENLNFKMRSETYQTVWIDTDKKIDVLRSQLHRKWRNHLVRAEKYQSSGRVEIQVEKREDSSSSLTLDLFLEGYQNYKNTKGFLGPSPKFVKTEIQEAQKSRDVILIWALEGNNTIAGIMLARHGNTLSYRIGWSSEKGRKYSALYLLVWAAIVLAQKNKALRLDLGGILPQEAFGVTEFKVRTGGWVQSVIGIFS